MSLWKAFGIAASEFVSLRLPMIIFVITVVGFLPTLWNGFIDWQDARNIIENPNYRGFDRAHLAWMFSTGQSGYYEPLTWLTYAIDFSLWELDPFGFHLTSLVIHGANAALLYTIVLRLLASVETGASPSTTVATFALPCVAACAVLFFSLHPLRVEAVAWVSARTHLLSAFFFLAALFGFLRAAEPTSSETSYRKWMCWTITAHGLSILSGANGLALPILITLLDFYPLRRLARDKGLGSGPKFAYLLLEKLPFLALACAGIILARQLQPATAASAEPIGQLEWLAQTLYGPVFYLWKTVAPFRLAPTYQLPEVVPVWQWALFLGGVWVITLVVGVLYYRSGHGAGPVAWLCYLAMVFAPRIENGPDGFAILADRFSYLPSFVLVGVSAAGLLRLSRAWKPGKLSFLTLAGGIGGVLFVLGALGILAWRQTGFWHDPEKLWRHSLTTDPESRQARERLAAGLIAQNKEDQALELYDTAVRHYPDSALAHADLARALATKGQLDNALRHYGRALEINPALPQALFGIGNVLVRQGEFHGAIEHYRKALKSTPSARIYVGLGYALARLGQVNEAIDHYRSALRIDSTNVEAYYNLASTLAIRGQFEEAIENYRKAVKILPSHSRAHYGLANALVSKGSLKEAMEHYQEAINHNPDFAEAYINVGITLANQGQLDSAIAYFRHALGIRPGLAEARLNLARALAAQGKKEEALREYEEVKRFLQSRNVPPAAP